MDLEQLQQLMNAGAGAQGQLPGLEEQYATAAALRDNPMPTPGESGYVSPLEVMANVVGASTGRRNLRGVNPRLEKARAAIAAGDSGQQQYKLFKQVADDKRQQENWQANYDAGRADAGSVQSRFDTTQALAREKEEARKRELETERNDPMKPFAQTRVWPDGTTRSVVQLRDGRYIDTATREEVDVTGSLSAAESAASTKAAAKAKEAATGKIDKPPAAVITRVATADTVAKGLKDAIKLLAENPNAIAKFEDLPAHSLNAVGLDSPANLFKSLTKNPGEKATRVAMQKVVDVFRHSELGSQLTGFELSEASKWSPLAGGIDSEESMQRMNALLKAITDKSAEFKRPYEAFYKSKGMSGGVETTETDLSVAPAGTDQGEWDGLDDEARQDILDYRAAKERGEL